MFHYYTFSLQNCDWQIQDISHSTVIKILRCRVLHTGKKLYFLFLPIYTVRETVMLGIYRYFTHINLVIHLSFIFTLHNLHNSFNFISQIKTLKSYYTSQSIDHKHESITEKVTFLLFPYVLHIIFIYRYWW